MKKLLFFLLLLLANISVAQVHTVPIFSTHSYLRDSILANGKHVLKIETDTIVSFTDKISSTKDITTTGNISADTLKGTGNQITNIKRGNLALVSSVKAPPAVSTDYYLGNAVLPIQTSDGIPRIYVSENIIIKSIVIQVYRIGATSNQATSVYLQVNGVNTDTLTTTWDWSAANVNKIIKTGLSRSVSSGDYIAIKITTAAWTPNIPTSIYVAGSIYYE